MLLGTNVFSQNKHKNVETFIKIWGFLKYHHPAVAKGNLNWDSVYTSNISKMRKPNSNTNFNTMVLNIIKSLGSLQKDSKARLPDTFFAKNHDLKWIDADYNIQPKLKALLKEIYVYRNQGQNKYIKSTIDLTADYSGEFKYEDMGFPNQNYRLLFLARFWNIINYFAPYKYTIGTNWGNILTRFIPKMIAATDTATYYKTWLLIAKSLNDGHAQFTIAESNTNLNNIFCGNYTAPLYSDIVHGKVIVRKIIIDSFNQINIKQGDIILNINNEPIAHRIKRFGALISASNNVAHNKYLNWYLFRTPNQYQSLTIKRGKHIFKVRVKCISTSNLSWGDLTNYTGNEFGYKTIGKSIAYIYASQIWHGDIDTIKALIKSKKAVIFDVRNYPNSDDFYNIFDMFLPSPKVINQSLCLSIDNPGYFFWKPSNKIGNNNSSPYKGKVVILADERTQSQGEYSVMCLQTIPNSVTIGSQTAGHDGVVTNIPIGGKLTLSYSGYGIFYPNKTSTQRRGIHIDIPAPKTVASTIKNHDVALEKALEYLKQKGIN